MNIASPPKNNSRAERKDRTKHDRRATIIFLSSRSGKWSEISIILHGRGRTVSRCSFHVHWDSKRSQIPLLLAVSPNREGLKRKVSRKQRQGGGASSRLVASRSLAPVRSAPLRRAFSISGLVSRPHRPPPFPLDVSVAPLSPSVESRGLRGSHFRPSSSLLRRRRDPCSTVFVNSQLPASRSLSLWVWSDFGKRYERATTRIATRLHRDCRDCRDCFSFRRVVYRRDRIIELFAQGVQVDLVVPLKVDRPLSNRSTRNERHSLGEYPNTRGRSLGSYFA